MYVYTRLVYDLDLIGNMLMYAILRTTPRHIHNYIYICLYIIYILDQIEDYVSWFELVNECCYLEIVCCLPMIFVEKRHIKYLSFGKK